MKEEAAPQLVDPQPNTKPETQNVSPTSVAVDPTVHQPVKAKPSPARSDVAVVGEPKIKDHATPSQEKDDEKGDEKSDEKKEAIEAKQEKNMTLFSRFVRACYAPELPDESKDFKSKEKIANERREKATEEVVARMMKGWDITEKPCNVCGIPLMNRYVLFNTCRYMSASNENSHKAVATLLYCSPDKLYTECPVCGPAKPKNESDLLGMEFTQGATSNVESITETTSPSLIVPQGNKSVKQIREDVEAEIGMRLVVGWTICENNNCTDCNLPLLRSPDQSSVQCVLCGVVSHKEVDIAKYHNEVGNRVLQGWTLTQNECVKCGTKMMQDELGQKECVLCVNNVSIKVDLPSNFDFSNETDLKALLCRLQTSQLNAVFCQSKVNEKSTPNTDSNVPVEVESPHGKPLPSPFWNNHTPKTSSAMPSQKLTHPPFLPTTPNSHERIQEDVQNNANDDVLHALTIQLEAAKNRLNNPVGDTLTEQQKYQQEDLELITKLSNAMEALSKL